MRNGVKNKAKNICVVSMVISLFAISAVITTNAYQRLEKLNVIVMPDKDIVHPGETTGIKVTVTGFSNNQPLENASVSLKCNEGSIDPSQGLTDSQGIFKTVYKAPSNVSDWLVVYIDVNATKQGYEDGYGYGKLQVKPGKVLQIRMDATPWEIESGKMSKIDIKVLSGTALVPNASVSLKADMGSLSPINGFTDSNGTFKSTYGAPIVQLPVTASVEAKAHKEGFVDGFAQIGIKIRPLANSTCGWIAGTVYDAFTAKPIQSVVVTCTANNTAISTKTDEKGYYALALKPDKYDVIASKNGYYSSPPEVVEIKVNETIYLDIKLTPTGPPPPPFYIKIEPPVVIIHVGESAGLVARAYDSTGQELFSVKFKWDVVGGVGNLNPNTGPKVVFTATTVGFGKITVKGVYQNQSAESSADVIVEQGSGNFYIVVTPRTVRLFIGDKLKFTAQGYDKNGTPIPNLKYKWNLVGKIGTIDPYEGDTTVFIATAEGGGELTAAASYQGENATGKADIYVKGAQPSSFYIEVKPEYAKLFVGESQNFTAQGYDKNGTPIPNLKYKWTCGGGIGYVNPDTGDTTTFTATTEGIGYVSAIADYQGETATGKSEIYVGPGGGGYYVLITPNSAKLTVGDVQKFVAQMYDAGGNPVMNAYYTWDVEGGIGFINSVPGSNTGVFTATNPGFGEVIAEAITPNGQFAEGRAKVLVGSIPGVDLAVSEKDIGFSNPHPQNGELVIIYALIHNNGLQTGKGEVRFYAGGINGTQIGFPQQVYVIPGWTDVAFVEWNATNGTHEIYVVIDKVQPNDTNLKNNIAHTTIKVGAPSPPNLEISYTIAIEQSGNKTTVKIMIKVFCRYNPVSNLHIVVWDSADLTLDFFAENVNLMPQNTATFVMKITVKSSEYIDRELLVQAVSDESSTGVIKIPIRVGERPRIQTEQFLWNLLAICISVGASVGIGAALFFRRRYRNRSLRATNGPLRTAVHKDKKGKGA